jgi:hypothetical protein
MNWKGLGRRLSWSGWCNTPQLTWIDWEKPRKTLRLPGRWFRILEVIISNVDLETNFESVTLFLWFCSDRPGQFRVCTYSSVRPLLFTFSAVWNGPTLQRRIVEAIGSVVKRIKYNGMLPVCMIRTSDFIVEESKAIRSSIVWPLLL